MVLCPATFHFSPVLWQPGSLSRVNSNYNLILIGLVQSAKPTFLVHVWTHDSVKTEEKRRELMEALIEDSSFALLWELLEEALIPSGCRKGNLRSWWWVAACSNPKTKCSSGMCKQRDKMHPDPWWYHWVANPANHKIVPTSAPPITLFL